MERLGGGIVPSTVATARVGECVSPPIVARISKVIRSYIINFTTSANNNVWVGSVLLSRLADFIILPTECHQFRRHRPNHVIREHPVAKVEVGTVRCGLGLSHRAIFDQKQQRPSHTFILPLLLVNVVL